MKAKGRARPGGFSLIELMAVLVIVLLLGAFLASRYTGAGNKDAAERAVVVPKQRAEQTVGASNVHQLDMALQMYRDANEGQNPPNLQALKPYGVTDEMLLDPVTRQPLAYDPQTGRIGTGAGGAGTAGAGTAGAGSALPRVPGF